MYKTILAHLTGKDCDNIVLETAYCLARPFGGHIDCLYTKPDLVAALTRMTGIDLAPGFAIEEAYKKLAEDQTSREETAHRTFERFSREHRLPTLKNAQVNAGVTVAWDAAEGAVDIVLTEQARLHDIAVIGPRDGSNKELNSAEMGNLLLDCGRPIFVAGANPPNRPFRKIAVAWKDTADASRAVNAAMPLIEEAGDALVLGASESDKDCLDCLTHHDEVAAYLRWHGVAAGTSLVLREGRDVPEAVCDRARNWGADVLVMGGYGHNRLRELAFGGFTQAMIAQNPLPVLIYH